MNMNYKNYKNYEFSTNLLEQAIAAGPSYVFEKTLIDGPANTIGLTYYLIGDIVAKEKDNKFFALTEAPEDAQTITIHLDNPGITIKIYKTVSEETWERQAVIDKCREKESEYAPCSVEEIEAIYTEYLRLKSKRHKNKIEKLKIQDDLELAYFHVMIG